MAVDLNQLAAQDSADTKAAVAAQAQQKQQEQEQPTFLSKWLAPVGHATLSLIDSTLGSLKDSELDPTRGVRDAAVGIATAAKNTADAVNPANMINESMEQLAGKGNVPVKFDMPIWDHASNAVADFRDAVAVKDPTIADDLLQSGAQLAIPFSAYSRALGGLQGFANFATAGVATDITALAPHDARLADVLSLGRSTEGKFGEVLRKLAPDGGALNAYITYLGDRGNETEAEGRFKNALDGFGANLILMPLLHTVGSVLKQGRAGLNFALENGARKSSDLALRDLDPQEEAVVKNDVARSAANPDAPHPPLRQDAQDPLEAEAERQAREDADRVEAAREQHTGAVDNVRSMISSVNTSGEELPLHTLVTHLADNLNDSVSKEGAFYRDLFGQLKGMNLPTKVVASGAEGTHARLSEGRGSYSGVDDTLAVHPKGLKGDNLLHTLAHESMHAATTQALKESPTVARALSSLAQETSMSEAYATLSKQDKYGAKPRTGAKFSADEFVAEAASNPRFQAALKVTKSSVGKGTLWDEYKDLIANIIKPGAAAALVASPYLDKVLTVKEKPGA